MRRGAGRAVQVPPPTKILTAGVSGILAALQPEWILVSRYESPEKEVPKMMQG